jgi:CheY-like chemotaxis protein
VQILVVDQHGPTREVMGTILSEMDHDVVAVADLDLVYVKALIPALLILDLPPSGGPQAFDDIAALRAHEPCAAMPIIVSSTSPTLLYQDARQLQRLGCFPLEKPFELSAFIELVRQALG